MKPTDLLSGVALCAAITLIAVAGQEVEEAAFGYAYIEALVLALLVGTLVRTAWTPGPRFRAGISFCARHLLEIAIALLGATVSFSALAKMGLPLIGAIAGVVVAALIATYFICRAFGLSPRLSILLASGNSICGNTAIAAVAPVVGASPKDVASAIAFTSVLGIAVVLGLPLLVPVFHLYEAQYGVLAGLAVYAVPQVLAATLPIGALSNQVGTLVKLVRVLMLGPLVIALSVFYRPARDPSAPLPRAGILHFVPWFIVAFVVLAGLRVMGIMPDGAHRPIALTSKWMTTLAMAALGLDVDLRAVGRTELRVVGAVTLSLVFLIALGLAVAIWLAPQ